MGLGVLDARDEHVPGTTHLLNDDNVSAVEFKKESGRATNGLKYDKTGKFILVPQPSDDPNDPLNWPLWKRDSMLLILCLISVIASTLSPLLAANTLTISLIFQKTFTEAALLTGYHLLGVGVAGFLFVASARVWGKRHLYLLGTILIIISSAWGGAAGNNEGGNYESLLWARVVQGIGLAPFEALVNASVGDLYFVHERGLRMAASNMALFGGAFFTPIIVGVITHTLGWSWSFYFISIFAGAMLPLIFFFVPETAFRRDERFNTDVTGEKTPSGSETPLNRPEDSQSSSPGLKEFAHGNGQQGFIPKKKSYARTLLPFDGWKTDESLIKILFRPLPLFFHPAIAWACLIQGALIGWTVLIGVVLAAIFLGPPLWFDEVKTGYMYAGPFIGAVLGFILSGLMTDFLTRYMIRKNNGVYEPEFRILLVIPQLVIGGIGLFGFGWAAANVQPDGWFLPDFFFALEVMGMVIGAVASALYIVDAHREYAIEAFTCMLIFKNVFSFGLTYAAYDWLIEAGIWKIFVIIASIQVGICLLSVPMYVFGKRNRALMKRYDILKILHLYGDLWIERMFWNFLSNSWNHVTGKSARQQQAYTREA